MKIHHVVGPLTLVLFATAASGQEAATRNPFAPDWGEAVETRGALTLDDKVFRLGRDAGESAAGTATAQARAQSEEWKSRAGTPRSEEHTSELQSPCNLVCRLLLGKKKRKNNHV